MYVQQAPWMFQEYSWSTSLQKHEEKTKISQGIPRFSRLLHQIQLKRVLEKNSKNMYIIYI